MAKASIPCESVILNDEEVVPDEKAIGEIMTAYPMGYDLVLGVGSGTLNDLCKFVSHRLGIDYIIFATAPSMDGFVSRCHFLLYWCRKRGPRHEDHISDHIPAAFRQLSGFADPAARHKKRRPGGRRR
ncbi:MAG: iron-containing alcohol dehydrogenase [Lachnospiraceae bacterium]|nr:iron-containing alcohol dehydrogenase [Lachnospiraceae bacterium]